MGAGLRSPHLATLATERPDVGFFEVLADNWIRPGPLLEARLHAVCDPYDVALHCVAMDVGGTDPLDASYLADIARLCDELRPEVVTDHLCFVGAGGRTVPDLLPLPYDAATLAHVVERVRRVQDALGRRIGVENASAYLAWPHSTMRESVFLAELAERADCHLLLDVNNLYVNATNLGFDAVTWLRDLPADRVCLMHLAGHERWDDFLVDTHSRPICDEVLELYCTALGVVGPAPTVVEWDRDIPTWPELRAELARVEAVRAPWI